MPEVEAAECEKRFNKQLRISMSCSVKKHIDRQGRVGVCIGATFLAAFVVTDVRAEWLTRITVENGTGQFKMPADATAYFLQFGTNSFAPDIIREPGASKLVTNDFQSESVAIALFENLRALKFSFPNELAGKQIEIEKSAIRDAFWDQVVVVSQSAISASPDYEMVEASAPLSVLPSHVRERHYSTEETERQKKSLSDPHIGKSLDKELAWRQIESLAFPLDFQKVLLASPNDASPGFAYQNGQWFTTWLSRDLPKWNKEDHWFAPALLIDRKLVRPAPLSAKTNFVTTSDGVTIPVWTIEWTFRDATVRQAMFSQASGGGKPCLHVMMEVKNSPPSAKLVLGVGRRPNAHYWDDLTRERTPIPFFTLKPQYKRRERQLIDASKRIVLASAQDFKLEELGVAEMLLSFTPDERGCVYLCTPQTDEAVEGVAYSKSVFDAARAEHERRWKATLRQGARAELPSAEWMKRMDIWQSQVAAITRVHYDSMERLSYGAYFYQTYFGPEEGWPIVALAQWGRAEESHRQAEIMLSAENRSKESVYHQSRNGVFAWYAAETARLTNDSEWLKSVASALIENAEWTIQIRRANEDKRTAVTRGLLPPHIYGGDIRDSATSLYASIVCWKGLKETAEVFRSLGSDALVKHAEQYDIEARRFRKRLDEVIDAVVDRDTRPPFLPLALALPSLQGKNEGPYERLTDSRLGNYWNLFAPSVMELGLESTSGSHRVNDWLLDYMENHGGSWAGLPRFHTGLDAAYSIGAINERIALAARDVRYHNYALASLESFFLHAASRNGYSIPEVATLFPDRLEPNAYERLVREAPWSFGIYSADEYINGHISFTEPLGAAAGEALWMIRNALVYETRGGDGRPDGQIVSLSTVPSEWFAEGKEIMLTDFPTYYGIVTLHVVSRVESQRKIEVAYKFRPYQGAARKSLVVRLAPPGKMPRDWQAPSADEGAATIDFD